MQTVDVITPSTKSQRCTATIRMELSEWQKMEGLRAYFVSSIASKWGQTLDSGRIRYICLHGIEWKNPYNSL